MYSDFKEVRCFQVHFCKGLVLLYMTWVGPGIGEVRICGASIDYVAISCTPHRAHSF